MLYALDFDNAHRHGDLSPRIHRLRHRVFIEAQNYDVSSYKGMEYDAFDTPATTHLAWVDDDGTLRGCSRLNPTERPYMLKCVFGGMIAGEAPSAPEVWEASRLCVVPDVDAAARRKIVRDILIGYLEFAGEAGIEHYVGLMPLNLWDSVFGACGWDVAFLGPEHKIQGKPARAGQVRVCAEILERLRAAAGLKAPLLDILRPPPAQASSLPLS